MTTSAAIYRCHYNFHYVCFSIVYWLQENPRRWH